VLSPGSAETNVGWGEKLNSFLMANCVRNIFIKNHQNLIIVFQVTVKNVGDVFLRHSVVYARLMVCFDWCNFLWKKLCYRCTKHQFIHFLTATLENSHIKNSKNHKTWYCPHHADYVSMCCWCKIIIYNSPPPPPKKNHSPLLFFLKHLLKGWL